MRDHKDALLELSRRGVAKGPDNLLASVNRRLKPTPRPKPTRSRSVTAIAAAAGAFVLVIAVAIVVGLVLRGDGGSEPDIAANTGSQTEPTEYDVGLDGFTESVIAVSDESIWTSGPANEAGQAQPLVRTNRESGEREASIELDSTAISISNDFQGGLWVVALREGGSAPHGAVMHVDPETNDVDRSTSLESPGQIAVTTQAVWVTDPRLGYLYRIDPATADLLETVVLPGGASFVAASDSAVWVSNPLSNVVSRIDPATNAIVATQQLNGTLGELVVTPAGVWVIAQEAGTLLHLDPSSGAVIRTVPLPGSAIDIAAATNGGLVGIVRAGEGTQLVEVDPVSGEVTPVAPATDGTVVAMTVAGNKAWALDLDGRVGVATLTAAGG